MIRRALVVALCCGLTAQTMFADDSPEAFRTALVRVLRAHDHKALQSYVAFPVHLIQPGDRPLFVADTVLLSTAGIFWPDTICAIERGAIREMGDRVTIGGDALVARRQNGRLRITEMKMRGGPLKPKAKPLAAMELRIRGARRQAAGNLEFDEVDTYDVATIKGLTLQGTLERFPGNNAVFRVTDAKGKPVNAAADGRRTWTATIPESGHYRVEIVRKAPYCDPLLTYLLTLTAR